MEAGQSREINLAPYLESGVANPTPTVVSIDVHQRCGCLGQQERPGQRHPAGRPGGERARGVPGRHERRRRLLVRTRASGRGPDRVRRVRSSRSARCAADATRTSRRAPSAWAGSRPRTTAARRSPATGSRRCSRATRSPAAPTSATSRVCENRKKYNFRVAAVNKVGTGPWSDLSQTAYADTKPGRVSNIRMISRGDHTITLGWTQAGEQHGDPDLPHQLAGRGGRVAGSHHSYHGHRPRQQPEVRLLDRGPQQRQLVAAARVDAVPVRSARRRRRAGSPSSTGSPGWQATDVTATWTATLPEGPAPTLYTLAYSRQRGAADGRARVQPHPGHDVHPHRGRLRRRHLRLLRAGSQRREDVAARLARHLRGGRQARQLGSDHRDARPAWTTRCG